MVVSRRESMQAKAKSVHHSSSHPKMIDISEKPIIRREATAEGTIFLKRSTLKLIATGKIEKGDPFQIATIGAIQAVKSTPQWMMMCHPIPVESTDVEISQAKGSVRVRVKVIAFSKTGVEMEALNGVAAALLNIWDVVKKYEKDEDGQYPLTRIADIHVVEKVKGIRG
ncbi:MAG TPA: cyclic pyranopterin monophosphate synthase MoaC [Nitrososphaerales archaeon]|nr:cyclic pyranopterin monophosphate synthase MoaC [Nitrososphaerales archaeon]